MKYDGNNQQYIRIGNIRLTLIKETWAGSPGIRIQATDLSGCKVFPGPEIPIPNFKTAMKFIGGFVKMILHALKMK